MKKVLFLLGVTMTLYAKSQTIVFGAGCFWGVEKFFSSLEGVKDATSGYAGGNYENPTYRKVLNNRHPEDGVINHTEVVEVVYDDKIISTEALIKSFWELHDPTQGDRQGNDKGNNYRSAIYYTTDEQKEIAFKTKEIYQKLLSEKGYGKITTEIKPLDKFYKAEEYHQDYLLKNPNGYCPNHSTGVKFGSVKIESKTLSPLGGKEIVVVDAPNCGFCQKFKEDVLDGYRGSLPLRVAKESELKGFELKSKIVGTPTILFIVDGKEVNSFTGYLDKKDFYKAVGEFKLGKDTQAYDVAFNAATDSRFCRQYDEFKHTPDGVFIDKVSGDILFDTRDRFNSGSGWLSFYKAVDGAVIEKEDNSHGMRRVEVIAKKSGAHLGHVFDDAPGGRQRYCINATILEFVKREDIKK
jgi:peptide methionine sulfoxide reductase msrA/msrB